MAVADISGQFRVRKIMHSGNGAIVGADAIREARMALGMTQARLAQVLQLSGNGSRTIRRWESGATPVPGPVAILLAIWLDHASLRPRP